MFMALPNAASLAALSGDVAFRAKTNQVIVQVSDVFGGSGEESYYQGTGVLGDTLVPIVPDFRIKVSVLESDVKSLKILSTTEVLANVNQIVQLVLPTAPRVSYSAPTPSIGVSTLKFGVLGGETGPYLELDGKFLLKDDETTPAGSLVGTRLEDLFVTLEIGGRDNDTAVVGGADVIIGPEDLFAGDDDMLLVRIPRGAPLSFARVTVTRKQEAPLDGRYRVIEVPSNPVEFLVESRFGFVLNGGDSTVSVLDLLATEPIGNGIKSDPREVARISLGTGVPEPGNFAPQKSAITPDGTRLYVTNSAQGSISVIDAVALQEIDTVPDVVTDVVEGEQVIDPDTEGNQGIPLPIGAKPFDLTVDPDGRFVLVTDRGHGSVYVIDIDPFSRTFHTVIQTLSLEGTVGNLTPLGLRGIAVSADRKQVYIAAPTADLFRGDAGGPGRILVASLLTIPERRRQINELVDDQEDVPEEQREEVIVDPLVFDEKLPESIIEYGKGVYDITATDDPAVIVVTDRVDDRNGVGIIRRIVGFDDKVTHDVLPINLVPFGLNPREGRGVQAFGISNAQGVDFVPANAYESAIGKHPSYLVISGYNADNSPLDSKKNPELGPFFASYPGPNPDTDPSASIRSITQEVRTEKVNGQTKTSTVTVDRARQYAVGAGSNLGFIRNPLGNFDDPLTVPRLVAGTNPVLAGFADDVTVTQQGYAMIAMQRYDAVFAYSMPEAIRVIEKAAKAGANPVGRIVSQYADVPTELESLVNGPLGQIPIDQIYSSTIVAASFGYFSDGNNTGYGVPKVGPVGEDPNLFGPIPVGNLPRGIESQPEQFVPELRLQPTPYTSAASLQAFPDETQTVEAGRTSQVEIHTGAIHETHTLVSYRSQEASRGLVLHYDSLRAEPRPLAYFGLANLNKAELGEKLVVRATASLGDQAFAAASGYDPKPGELAVGYRGDEHFFAVDVSELNANSIAGGSLLLDLREAPTGAYDLAFDFGLFQESAAGWVDGNFQTEREFLPVVNLRDSEFGAGWSIEGLMRIYEVDGVLLLVDGNGTEQIFNPPQVTGQAYTPVTLDRSVLKKLDDGSYLRQMIDGTEENYRADGKLQSVVDRNGNATTYLYNAAGIEKIVDPVGLETVFEYSGPRVSKITDPAGRVTKLDHADKQLIRITDPDDSKRTFGYDPLVPTDDLIAPFDYLLSDLTAKRGNDGDEPFDSTFSETITYDDFGRVSGGTRIDGQSFSLTPAQKKAVSLPELTSDPDSAPLVVDFLTIPPQQPSVEAAHARCGLGPEATEGSTFTAEAIYTDFDGVKQTFQMNGFGQFIHVQNQDGNGNQPGRAFGRDAADGLISVTVDQVNNITCSTFDEFGNTLTFTDFPDRDSTTGVTTTYTYGNASFKGMWTEKVDGVGRKIERVLDSSGNVISETLSTTATLPQGNPKSSTTLWDYYLSGPADGLPSRKTDPIGIVTTYTYDAYGRLTNTTYPDGEATQSYANLRGNVTGMTDPDGFATVMTYDAMNRFESSSIVVSIDGVTYTESADYDAEGNRVEFVDRNGNITKFSFDEYDRPIEQIDSFGDLNAKMQFAYEFGEMVLAGGADVEFNPDFNYIYTRDPLDRVTLMVEDRKGNPRQSVDGIGRSTSFTYNDAYQLTGVSFPNGGAMVITVDGRGRQTKSSGPTTEITEYAYDEENRLIKQTIKNPRTGDQVTTFEYNLFATPAKTTAPNGVVSLIEHDASNRPRKIIENFGWCRWRSQDHHS